MDTFIRYAESNEARYEGIQNKSRTHSRNRRRKQPSRERISSRSRSQEQLPRWDRRHRDYEKAMQEPCPKHSRPGRPANHMWDQCYFVQDYRRLVEKKQVGMRVASPNLTNTGDVEHMESAKIGNQSGSPDPGNRPGTRHDKASSQQKHN